MLQSHCLIWKVRIIKTSRPSSLYRQAWQYLMDGDVDAMISGLGNFTATGGLFRASSVRSVPFRLAKFKLLNNAFRQFVHSVPLQANAVLRYGNSL